MTPAPHIRPATVRDVPAIAALIETFAARGKMLFRSHAELYETIRDFLVAEVGGLKYPIKDGIPVLLVDQAVLPEGYQSLADFKAKFAPKP